MFKQWSALFAITIFFGCYSHACKLQKKNSSFYWSDEELVKQTAEIYWVKVVKIVPLKESAADYDKRAEYKLEILKILKGKHKRKYLITKNFVAPKGDYKDLSKSHISPTFQGRSFYGPDCEIYEHGYPDKTYLYFVNSFHPKFFEEVGSIDDEWFKRVLKLTKNKK